MASKRVKVEEDEVVVEKQGEGIMGTLGSILKAVTGYITGEAIVDTLDDVQDRIEMTTQKVIKTATIWVVFLAGVFFTLWGIGLFLSDFYGWYEGLGLVLVGAVIMALMLFVKAMR